MATLKPPLPVHSGRSSCRVAALCSHLSGKHSRRHGWLALASLRELCQAAIAGFGQTKLVEDAFE
eukprot:7730990-Prorocentrum_lima.AAC.1